MEIHEYGYFQIWQSFTSDFVENGSEIRKMAGYGIKRRASMFNTGRIDQIYEDPHMENLRFVLHYGDLTDSMNLTRIIQEVRPDEIYKMGSMSHVKVSFESPEYTADSDALGTLRVLDFITAPVTAG